MNRTALLLGFIGLFVATSFRLAICEESTKPVDPLPRSIPSPSLPNLIQIHERIFVGGTPVDGDAYNELSQLGVRTIVSVDGTRPNVSAAQKAGIKYIHLPIGYDGIDSSRVMELAKAVRRFPGPIYMHCHHGRHRAPTAAATAAITLGMMQPSDGAPFLKLAGTATRYRGLHQSVLKAKPVPLDVIDQLDVDFVEAQEVPIIAQSMTVIEKSFHSLKQLSAIKDKNQQTRSQAVTQLTLLEEHFFEAVRLPTTIERGQSFVSLFSKSHDHVKDLRSWLERDPDAKLADPKFSRGIKQIEQDCNHCHVKYRN